MSQVPLLVEAYLSANLLVTVSALIASLLMSGTAVGRLRVARLVLACSLLAPVLMIFVHPLQKPIVPISIDIGDLTAELRAVSPPSASSEGVDEILDERLGFAIDPSLMLFVFIILGAFLHVGRTWRDTKTLRRIIERSVELRRRGMFRIVVSPECSIPFSVRFLRSAYVVVPAPMLQDPRSLAISIAHEAQHHRQGDCCAVYAVELFRALFFWNPFIHRWQRMLSDLQEFACDETLVGRRRFSPHEYGRCLYEVALAAFPSRRTRWELACAPGMARLGRGKPQHLLSRRIEMLSRYRSVTKRPPAVNLAFALALLTIPFGLAFAARGSLALPEEVVDLAKLDPRIQAIAEEEVSNALVRHRAGSAVAMIMDATTGRVLAFAESGVGAEKESWTKRVFAPASTIKPFVVAAAIEAGVASASGSYNCREPYQVAGKTFRNWNEQLPDVLTTKTVLAASVNVCTIHLAREVGSATIRSVLGRFGLQPSWDRATDDALQLAQTAIGSLSPVTIQRMTRAFAALANQGRLPGDETVAVSPATVQVVEEGLIEAVSTGTGRRASLPNVVVAGKTGTSEVATTDQPSRLAMFGGYFEKQGSNFAAFVLLEDALTSAGVPLSGGQAAAPLFRRIAERSLKLVN